VPGVGEVDRSQTCLHWGNESIVPDEPTAIPNLVARTR
jgi:hypothetical protein